MTTDDRQLYQQWMQRCLALAEAAVARGDLGVGSLVVRAGLVVAEASETLPTQPDVIGHAELLAVRRASLALGTLDLSDCTLVTTAEPCWMCSYAIRETGIRRVIIGAATPDVGGISTAYPLLTDASLAVWGPPPEIVMGVLAEACARVRVTGR